MTARFHLTSKQDYASLGRGHFERDQIETFLALLNRPPAEWGNGYRALFERFGSPESWLPPR